MKLPSYSFLIPVSLLLGMAPFVPEPHLVEKIRWLFTGHPFRPIDVFDLFLHGTFPALLVLRAGGDLVGRFRGAGGGPGGGAGETGAAGKSKGGTGGDNPPPQPPKTRAERRKEVRKGNKS